MTIEERREQLALLASAHAYYVARGDKHSAAMVRKSQRKRAKELRALLTRSVQ